MSLQKRLVQEGHGWTILPGVGIATDVASGSLSAAPLSDPEVWRTIVLGTEGGPHHARCPGGRTTTRRASPVRRSGRQVAVGSGRKWPAKGVAEQEGTVDYVQDRDVRGATHGDSPSGATHPERRGSVNRGHPHHVSNVVADRQELRHALHEPVQLPRPLRQVGADRVGMQPPAELAQRRLIPEVPLANGGVEYHASLARLGGERIEAGRARPPRASGCSGQARPRRGTKAGVIRVFPRHIGIAGRRRVRKPKRRELYIRCTSASGNTAVK